MPTAYVLINSEIGAEDQVLKEIKKVKNVVRAEIKKVKGIAKDENIIIRFCLIGRVK